MARSKKLQDALNSLNSQRNNSSTNTYDENKINFYANQYRQQKEAASKMRAEQESAAKNNAINQGLQTLGIATPTGKQKLYGIASSMYDPNSLNGKKMGQSGIYQGSGRTIQTSLDIEEQQKAFERTLNTKPITASEAKQLGK